MVAITEIPEFSLVLTWVCARARACPAPAPSINDCSNRDYAFIFNTVKSVTLKQTTQGFDLFIAFGNLFSKTVCARARAMTSFN